MSTGNSRAAVKYEFIRNATARLHYAGRVFLLDPMLSTKGAFRPFAGIAPNPVVDLPTAVDDVVEGIDAVVVSHLHPDHVDDAAVRILSTDLPVYTPNNTYAPDRAHPSERQSFQAALQGHGFTDVRLIDCGDGRGSEFSGVAMHQTWARHGRGLVGELIGEVNGIVFEANGYPTIYWAGDTVYDEVEIGTILGRFRPDVVIAHTGGPVIEAVSPEILLMDAVEGLRFFEHANQINAGVQMIAVHMEALDHCFSTREHMRDQRDGLNEHLASRFHIPADGEALTL